MRAATRLLATYLEAGAPTGLTGLLTHPVPRSTLIYLYRQTLDKLKGLPETSVYRQSVESVTKHRLSLVQEVVPPGYAEWLKRVGELATEPLQGNTEGNFVNTGGSGHNHSQPDTTATKLGEILAGGESKEFVLAKRTRTMDGSGVEWLLEFLQDESYPILAEAIPVAFSQQISEATTKSPAKWQWRTHSPVPQDQLAELKEKVAQTDNETSAESKTKVLLVLLHDPEKLATLEEVLLEEPQPTTEQVEELEAKISAGLIEEVIQVAEGELKLIEVMKQASVWDTLEESPLPGQWTAFSRNS